MSKSNKILRYVLLATSLVFITLGVFREEHLIVLQKAVYICLECIGIG